jgi:hypothetical protein
MNVHGEQVVEPEGVADPMPELIRSVADKPATAAAGTVLCLIAGRAVGSQRIVRARRRIWTETFLRASGPCAPRTAPRVNNDMAVCAG